jgi:hypothetical protein
LDFLIPETTIKALKVLLDIFEKNQKCNDIKGIQAVRIEFFFYPLANEVAKGYSNATVRPSFLPSFHPSIRPSVTSL